MNKLCFVFIATLNIFAPSLVFSQVIKLPDTCPTGHPRLLTDNAGRETLKKVIEAEEWAQKTYNRSRESIEKYVLQHRTDSSWLISRLQMYWKSHASNVYIKGGVYSHADGYAPVPTVRFTGTRDAVTAYGAPKLEDILPYMDDERGLYYVNKSKPHNPLEWVEQQKTGRIIESINRQIMGMAQTASFIYWYTSDENYAKFAFDLFDTYMMGMYYRNEPVDLNHSHNQTLVGLSSFQVIHEDILNELTVCYDFLFNYLQKKAPYKMLYYTETFKKWANLIIKNGVPFNNWNLIEARFVVSIAFILEDNGAYKDGKGFQYYLNEIFNKTYTRQWSIPKLMDYGYDFNTGIWNECPGYSQNVTGDFMNFIQLFNKTLGLDLLPQFPVLNKAVEVLPQYLYPNGYIVAFGDTYYMRLNDNPVREMISNAQKNNRLQQEILFTRLLKMLQEINGEKDNKSDNITGHNFLSLFSHSGFTMKDTIKPGKYEDFVTATFYAPNVSWFVQRNGFDRKNGLMISQAGSLGNHAHSNGIAMELYGKGYVLAPEAGIGTSYFQPDYKEYYSQFPAHNTVVVDGISAYPEMRSSHAFDLLHCYPPPSQKNGYFPIVTFSNLYFLEPETNADQNRLMSIIRTSDSTGYYIDIFRSKRKNGKDKYHDYFYHNLGQEMIISDSKGVPIALKPTERLTFADGDLFAYDYIWDKKSVITSGDITAIFKLSIAGSEDIFMGMWMKGSAEREFFSVKTPICKAITRGAVPKEIGELPVPAIVARQTGEAWTRPFVSVYEPYIAGQKNVNTVQSIKPENAAPDFVGLKVDSKNNRTQYILASGNDLMSVQYNDIHFEGTYGIVGTLYGALEYLFLGNGQKISFVGYSLVAEKEHSSATLQIKNNHIFFTSDGLVTLVVPDIYKEGKVVLHINNLQFLGKRSKQAGRPLVSFDLPKTDYTKVTISQSLK
jgi:hypothetical protein